MQANRTLFTVDSHTEGEPTRVVVGGIPKVPGCTMEEKRKYLLENLDNVRTALMHEPRGHRDMFGAVLTEPVSLEADVGVIFMDSGGYVTMCGHGSIGTAMTVVELGIVQPVEPETRVVLDTPAGLVRASVAIHDGKIENVTITNVPAFLFCRDITVDVPGFGDLTLDIAFGGNFFAMVNAERVGMRLEPREAPRLIELGLTIREHVNRQVHVKHPKMPYIDTVEIVEFCGEPSRPDAHAKNAVILGQGQLDRSPCGTGTSAKMATLHAKGELGLREEFVHEGIIGTAFRGRLVGEVKVEDIPAVIPQVTSMAYLTGMNQFVIDGRDPMKHGFFLP